MVREPESVAVDDGCGMLANSRGLEIEGHWGPTDADAVVPSERAAIFNQKVSFWEPKEAAREYPICGARLTTSAAATRHHTIPPADTPTAHAAPTATGTTAAGRVRGRAPVIQRFIGAQ